MTKRFILFCSSRTRNKLVEPEGREYRGLLALGSLFLIRTYQKSFLFRSPILKALFLSDAACRFQPTCSEYAYQAIRRYGIMRGGWMGLKRIIRCHPWSKGGWDPV